MQEYGFIRHLLDHRYLAVVQHGQELVTEDWYLQKCISSRGLWGTSFRTANEVKKLREIKLH